MRVLVAGGVFRHSTAELRHRQPAPEVVLAEGLRRHGLDVRTSPLEEWRRLALSRGCDVVHIHHLSKAAVAVALSPVARPFVFTEHASGHPRSRVHRAAQRIVFARATRVVCLSETEAEAKQAAYRLPASRIQVIPNGIARPPGTAPLHRLEADSPVVLLFVGQLRPVKQVHRAVEALAGLPSRVRLRLVYHNDEQLTHLRRQAREAGVEDRITFVGQLAGRELAEEYRRAHLLLLPSASEALPSVVTEALQHGLPVVASAVGGVPGQIADAGLLVSPDPAESLLPAVSAVIGDYDTYARRALARSASVSAEYSVEQMISRHLALYRSLGKE